MQQPAEAAMTPCEKRLFTPGPKHILALDGGGTKGIIELAFLARIEAILREHTGRGEAFRLADWFDLIGGTSTGAIIAAGLALGKSAAELTRLYLHLGPSVFRRRSWRVMGLVSRFDAKPLQALLQREFAERTLESPDLLTGLGIIAHRFDTGSPWLVSNNPRAPYWRDPADGSYRGNRHYRLSEVVRASTAAPGYFQPQEIAVIAGGKPALFVDGGLSPHNNPSLMLLMMTQVKAFGLRWPTGPENLRLISIGAGHYRRGYGVGRAPPAIAGTIAMEGLMQSLSMAQTQTLTLLQWLSDSPLPWVLNSEIGDLAGDVLGGQALMGFQRYDLMLDERWLRDHLGLSIAPERFRKLRKMDQPELMGELFELATKAAAAQVKLEHLTG